MIEADPIPSIRDELERKVIDELVRLATALQSGTIERGTYALVTRSLWLIVSGLIPADSLQLVADAADEYPTPKQRAVFFKAGNLSVFAWHPDRDGMTLLRMGLGKPSLTEIPLAAAERVSKLAVTFATLKASGWVQIP